MLSHVLQATGGAAETQQAGVWYANVSMGTAAVIAARGSGTCPTPLGVRAPTDSMGLAAGRRLRQTRHNATCSETALVREPCPACGYVPSFVCEHTWYLSTSSCHAKASAYLCFG